MRGSSIPAGQNVIPNRNGTGRALEISLRYKCCVLGIQIQINAEWSEDVHERFSPATRISSHIPKTLQIAPGVRLVPRAGNRSRVLTEDGFPRRTRIKRFGQWPYGRTFLSALGPVRGAEIGLDLSRPLAKEPVLKPDPALADKTSAAQSQTEPRCGWTSDAMSIGTGTLSGLLKPGLQNWL